MSVRFLMWTIFCVIFCIILLLFVLIYVIFTVSGASKQSKVVRQIEDNGGVVLYDYEYDFNKKNGRIANYVRPSAPHPILIVIFGRGVLRPIVYVQINSAKWNDTTIDNIDWQSLNNVLYIHLSGKAIDRRIITALSNLPHLRCLDLYDTSLDITDIDILREKLPTCRVRIIPKLHEEKNVQ